MTASVMLTVDEAAELLREAGWEISRSTAYELIQRGEIRAVKLGRRMRVPRDALAPYLGESPPDNDNAPALNRDRGVV